MRHLNSYSSVEPVVDGYTNGYVAGETDEDEEADPEAWEQVGPKKKSMHTRKVSRQKVRSGGVWVGEIEGADKRDQDENKLFITWTD